MPEQQPHNSAPFTPIPVSQEAGPSQPSLFAPPASPIHSANVNPVPPVTGGRTGVDHRAPQRIPYWLHQSERFLRIIIRIYIGMVVCWVPWYSPFWDANPLFAHPAWLTAAITQGAVRGVVSGLGLLNLWVALRELILGSSELS